MTEAQRLLDLLNELPPPFQAALAALLTVGAIRVRRFYRRLARQAAGATPPISLDHPAWHWAAIGYFCVAAAYFAVSSAIYLPLAILRWATHIPDARLGLWLLLGFACGYGFRLCRGLARSERNLLLARDSGLASA